MKSFHTNKPEDENIRCVNSFDEHIQLLKKQYEKVELQKNKTEEAQFSDIYFEDKKRIIDFVLVYQKSCDESNEIFEQLRLNYLNNLRNENIQMEEEVIKIKNLNLHFIKCHAPFEVLAVNAQNLGIPMPIQKRHSDKRNFTEVLFSKIKIPNLFTQNIPIEIDDYICAEFEINKINRFIGIEKREYFFSDSIRSGILNDILERTPYRNQSNGEIGIQRLISEGIFTAAYPPHEGEYKIKSIKKSNRDSLLNTRQILKKYWSSKRNFFKYQPLAIIRNYFGEKIGFYFSWLGQYISWLILPSLLGIIVTLYGIITLNGPSNQPYIDACVKNNTDYLMCPLCDEKIGCQYWKLRSSCVQLKFTHILDNEATVIYSILISLWAVLFIEFWKRKQMALSYDWNTINWENTNERPRPAFAAIAPLTERNVITGELEPYFPVEKRHYRMILSFMVIGFMIGVTQLFLVGTIVFRMLIIRWLSTVESWRSHAIITANVSGSFLSLFFILILSSAYSKIAQALTNWEMHRTQTQHEDALTLKSFIFHFFNNYSSVFYVAFFKGRFVGNPGNYVQFLEIREEECGPGGCLIDLATNLTVIMVGRQIIQMIIELLLPKLSTEYNRWKIHKNKQHLFVKQWQKDCDLAEHKGTFDEYLEMMIQFGFVTIFVASFPLAPIFALINNIIEVRTDATKLVMKTRRPVAERSRGIGIWLKIMVVIAHVAVLSNAFLIAFTSEFLPRLLYRFTISTNFSLDGYLNFSLASSPKGSLSQTCRYRDFRDEEGNLNEFYWKLLALRFIFILVFEHIIILTQSLIDWLVPDVPAHLLIKQKKEILAKRILMSNIKEDDIKIMA